MDALTELDHPTADQIYECLHEKYPSISKATVYRVLNRLSEEGEILHLRVPAGPDKFDITLSDHHHIECSTCGKLCDIYLPDFKAICSKIEKECGYYIKGCRLVFDGVCPECKQKQIIDNK